jgi:hypothetical protein
VSRSTPNLDLTVWDDNNDEFNPTELADNWDKVDAALDTSASFYPADRVEIRATIPVTNLFEGRLIFLTAAIGGFPAHTMLCYTGTVWKNVGPFEVFTTTLPSAGNFVGRAVVLISGGNKHLLINSDGADAWVQVGGIPSGTSLPVSPTAGDVYLLTAAASGFEAYSLIAYTGSAWVRLEKRGVETGATLPSAPYKGELFVLTANASGFKDLDLVQYTGSTWRLLTGPLYVTLADFITLNAGSVPGGYEVYLRIDDSEGVLWHLRYNAISSSPFKWESVGPNDLIYEIETDESPSVEKTWTDLTTVGPSWTIPAHIDGDFIFEARATQTPNTRVAWKIGLSVNDATPVKSKITHHGGHDTDKHSLFLNKAKIKNVNPGDVVKLKYWVKKVEPTIGDRVLSIKPVRIGVV